MLEAGTEPVVLGLTGGTGAGKTSALAEADSTSSGTNVWGGTVTVSGDTYVFDLSLIHILVRSSHAV